MKMFLLVLTLLLASHGGHQSHEHGFSSLSSPSHAAVFKLPELVLNEQEQDTDPGIPGADTTSLIHLAAFVAVFSVVSATFHHPVLAAHPIRGPPKALS